ncbi:hypothetical protein [Corynebacterium otitidis]
MERRLRVVSFPPFISRIILGGLFLAILLLVIIIRGDITLIVSVPLLAVALAMLFFSIVLTVRPDTIVVGVWGIPIMKIAAKDITGISSPAEVNESWSARWAFGAVLNPEGLVFAAGSPLMRIERRFKATVFVSCGSAAALERAREILSTGDVDGERDSARGRGREAA